MNLVSKSTRVIWEKNHINGEFFLQNTGTSEIPASSVMHESRVKKHPGDLGKKSYQRGIFLQNRGNSRVCWAPFAELFQGLGLSARRLGHR
jgi:hypothetical protein